MTIKGGQPSGSSLGSATNQLSPGATASWSRLLTTASVSRLAVARHRHPCWGLVIAVLGGLADHRGPRAQERGQHMGRPPRLTDAQKIEARRRRAQGATLYELARSYDVSESTISRHGEQTRRYGIIRTASVHLKSRNYRNRNSPANSVCPVANAMDIRRMERKHVNTQLP
jgi:DNA-binding CsgD family transcriptional regulator